MYFKEIQNLYKGNTAEYKSQASGFHSRDGLLFTSQTNGYMQMYISFSEYHFVTYFFFHYDLQRLNSPLEFRIEGVGH